MSNPNTQHDPENVKEEDLMDDNSDEVVEARQAMDNYFAREPENFGGGRSFI